MLVRFVRAMHERWQLFRKVLSNKLMNERMGKKKYGCSWMLNWIRNVFKKRMSFHTPAASIDDYLYPSAGSVEQSNRIDREPIHYRVIHFALLRSLWCRCSFGGVEQGFAARDAAICKSSRRFQFDFRAGTKRLFKVTVYEGFIVQNQRSLSSPVVILIVDSFERIFNKRKTFLRILKITLYIIPFYHQD